MQPEPAAVIACIHFMSCTSPAAKTPSTLVSGAPGGVTMYLYSSSSIPWSAKSFVFGEWPMP